jgi:HTH-type transcriptional regulator/antitoxin HigA
MTDKEKYKFALSRIEELLPEVDENMPANDKKAIELALMSDIVIKYEKEHYPIEKLSVSEVIALFLKESNMTQRQLAQKINVSPSRISDFVTGRAEPSLKYASMLCNTLNIPPAVMLSV